MHLLSQDDQSYLRSLIASAREPLPQGWSRWSLSGTPNMLGVLSAENARKFKDLLPSHAPLRKQGDAWVWHADRLSAHERGTILSRIALKLLEQGDIDGWRNEDYACWWIDETPWPYPYLPLFRLERAAFRFFGLRSHASHVHGITATGGMWCGRRSLTKATDPGRLDNLAAGGIPADEQPHRCAAREIMEEAGLARSLSQLVALPEAITTERLEPQGWHSETIFLYTTEVADTEVPCNQDGEVSEFKCLDLPEVLARMRADDFTRDAACAIAMYLLRM